MKDWQDLMIKKLGRNWVNEPVAEWCSVMAIEYVEQQKQIEKLEERCSELEQDLVAMDDMAEQASERELELISRLEEFQTQISALTKELESTNNTLESRSEYLLQMVKQNGELKNKLDIAIEALERIKEGDDDEIDCKECPQLSKGTCSDLNCYMQIARRALEKIKELDK